jgi:hypothetical protein
MSKKSLEGTQEKLQKKVNKACLLCDLTELNGKKLVKCGVIVVKHLSTVTKYVKEIIGRVPIGVGGLILSSEIRRREWPCFTQIIHV